MDKLTQYEQEYLDWLEDSRSQLEAFLRRSGFSREAAEDATQEAIIEAAKLVRGHTVETLRDRWQWLKTVAFRKARLALRNRWNRVVLFDPDTLADNPPTEEGHDCYSSVRAAYESLPPHLKDLVEYCYLQDHSYSEAAERFRIGTGVVSRRLNKARNLLRSTLCELPQLSVRAKAS